MDRGEEPQVTFQGVTTYSYCLHTIMFARTMLSTVFRCSRHSTAAFKHARIQHCARLYATVPENPGLNVDTSDKSTLYDKLRQNPVILGHLHKMVSGARSPMQYTTNEPMLLLAQNTARLW